MSLHEKIFLTDGYWTCPAGVTRVEVEGCGGGGGGGGGAQGGVVNTHYASGGGGGGAALLHKQFATVIPNVQYRITIGTGGTGGAGGTGSGDNGTAGGNTIMRIHPNSTIVAQMNGALGGVGGDLATSATDYKLAMGGCPTDQRLPPATAGSFLSGNVVTYCFGPGFGGEGTATQGVQVTRKGATSIQGYAGGSGGTYGSAGGGYPGGGGGGGGAGGPYGTGGSGFPGADGSATNGGNSSGGGGIADNMGSGGGGGGGGGSGGSSGGVGSNGLPASSGQMTIRWTT